MKGGLQIKAIVRMLGISRNTVRPAIASDGPPKYERTPAGSIVDEVEPRIRELLQSYPRMPATVIAERIGGERGLTVLKERVAELRPVYLLPDPVGRTSYVAGGDRSVRFVVSADRAAGQVRASPSPDVAAGVDDDHRILPLALGAAAADAVGGGFVRRMVAADRGVGRGVAGIGLGW